MKLLYSLSIIYISHCSSYYSYILMSQIINFLCLIPSKQHGLGLFYQHIQLLQHQVSGYAWRYLVISAFFQTRRTNKNSCEIFLSGRTAIVWLLRLFPLFSEAYLETLEKDIEAAYENFSKANESKSMLHTMKTPITLFICFIASYFVSGELRQPIPHPFLLILMSCEIYPSDFRHICHDWHRWHRVRT